MSKSISKRSSFLMVTDTAMVRKDGKVFAFEPVVRELDVFCSLFDRVEWIGFHRPDAVDNSTMVQVPNEVNCILLPGSGGDSLLSKIRVLILFPFMTLKILFRIHRFDVIHSRAPSSPAFIAALLSYFYQRKIWWHKYAGNWSQVNPPFFYGIQRAFLRLAYWSKVTINGKWPDQPSHCLSFENPCLNSAERQYGLNVIVQKRFEAPYTLCFVGRLEDAKGVGRILDALNNTNSDLIREVLFVGDGPDKQKYVRYSKQLSLKINFLGFLNRTALNTIYSKCNFILLPSTASEGFPKVLAEAMNYGCLPICSNVSSISQYIKHGENGFLWDINGQDFTSVLSEVLKNFSNADALSIISKAWETTDKFTYEHYQNRIEKNIIK